ncbi:MAG TPA: 3-deoxy-7-phosphoheptulonate synthase class II [Steroidobacteraceae bacterium]|nr:3-deoxy-7-phosphoheptulonate synthase class II [Steroidobacteraceae bacterium]
MVTAPRTDDWNPASWQCRSTLQQPVYRDPAALDRALVELASLPPIVVSYEVDELHERLAAVQHGQAFILQGGNCAESLEDCTSERIVEQLKILLQMSLVLMHGLKKPIIRIGRMAGQYAKPRSADLETRDGVSLPSYRGDIVNRPPFDAACREPDPQLLLRGYERAALTLNFVRALIDGGFADLHHPEAWDLDFMRHSPKYEEYKRIVESLGDSLHFFESVTGRPVHDSQRVSFYASHEGLHLLYEQAQTRFIPRRGRWYNLSAHLPWIGVRTAGLRDGHVEYFRGIANPIAVKVGPASDAQYIKELTRALNPERTPGRLTLIHRLGAGQVEAKLPGLIEAVRAANTEVVWMCDPMHGNTETTSTGIKTRRFDNILGELESSFKIHAAHGSMLGGVHLELTGDNVTECTGGARGLIDGDLGRAYRSNVDPRLNYEQAMEVAMRIARHAHVR